MKPKVLPPQTPREIAKFLVSNAADRVLCVGPLVWQPSDGLSSKVWYFVVGSADAEKQFHCDQVMVDGEEDYAAVLLNLMQQKPLVLHTFEAELDMAQWCAAIWPCERSIGIKTKMEAEHAAA
jgi:hypothetical protein